MRSVCLLVVLILLIAPAASAQRVTPWGDPDLQGVWTNRWEGKTLVVETANFNDRRLFRGATAQLRLVERFTRRDDETIDYRLTVTDPATFAQPWTLENALRKGDGGMFEVGCHEGNIGLRGILAGARVQER